jgi:hypothetical protein
MSYKLGYTTLPTFTPNSIGYVDVSANNVSFPLPLNNYSTGLITGLLLNPGVYIFTSTTFLSSSTGTLQLYLALSSTAPYDVNNTICNAAGSNNAVQGLFGVNLYHIFYVNTSKRYLNFVFVAQVGQSSVTYTYSYALCRIA